MSGGLEGSFLEDIVANIDDDTPRLVYADWLTEHGQDDRAEFIRVQVERARLPAWDAAQVRLRLRERALLEAHGEEWLAAMPAIKGVKWEGFRRGIVAEVSFASWAGLRLNAPAVRAAAPLEAASVRWPTRDEARSRPIAELRELTLRGRPSMDWGAQMLAGSPQLATIRVLTAPSLSEDHLRELAASPHLGRLRALRLPANILGDRGIRALTRVAQMSALEELDLSGPDVHDLYFGDPIIHAAGVEALAGWAGLATVRALSLSGSDVRRAGLRALLRSPHAAGLKSLSLRGARLDGQAMSEFADAGPGVRLEALDVGENVLKELGVDHLAGARCLQELKDLRVDRCEVPLGGARSLAKAAFMGGLRRLDAGHNHFGPVGLKALLERQPPALHTLRLRDNDLLDKGAALLAGSPASDGLLELDLSQNDLGAGGAAALGEAGHLRGLQVLVLEDNGISPEAGAALAASPLGERLAVLELEAAPPDS